MIVGFCGETEAQFEATLDLLRTVRYDQVFAAAYSVRPGTPATRLADDVPPAEKRRRLNALLARPGGRSGSSATGPGSAGRSRSSSRRRTPTAPRTTTTRSATQPRPTRPTVTGRTREHKLVHLAGGRARRPARSRPGSSTPARTRCGATRRPRRDRRSAAHRHRRRDRDRQDRPLDRARRRLIAARIGRPRSSRPTRARSTAASTSGRPRSPPPSGRGSRTTASISSTRTSRSASPTSPPTPGRRSPGSARAAASRSSSAARGCTCGPSRAGSRPTACRPTPPSAPGSRRELERGRARRRSSSDLQRAGARAGRGRSTCATRAASCGPSRSPSSPGDAPLPAPRGYPGPVDVARAAPSTPAAPRVDRDAGPGPVRRRPDRRGAGPARAVRPGRCPRSGHRLSRGVGRARRRVTREAAIERDAARNVAFAKRQRTWFRAEPGITWFDAAPDPAAAAVECREPPTAVDRVRGRTGILRPMPRTMIDLSRAGREGVPRRRSTPATTPAGRPRTRSPSSPASPRPPGPTWSAPSGRTAATSTRTGTSARARPRSSSRPRARPASTSSSPTTSCRPASSGRSRSCSTSRSSTAAG